MTPRAPNVDTQAFDVNIEDLVAAAAAPVRVRDTFERGQEASRERGINRATYADRLATAQAQSAGTARRAPIREEIEDINISGDLRVAEPTQTRRVLDANAAVENFTGENELAQQKTELDTEIARLQNLKTNIDRSVMERGRAQIEDTGRRELSAQNVEMTGREVKASSDLRRAEGFPQTTLQETPEGQFAVEDLISPTGEASPLAIKQTKTPREIQMEQQALESTVERARSFALQQERLNRGKSELIYQKDRWDKITGVTVIVMDPNGKPITIENFSVGADSIVTPSPIGAPTPDVEPLGPSAPQSRTAPRAPEPMPMQTSPTGEPIMEFGNEFIPTGEAISGYQRGGIYTNADGVRVIYTGGDPDDPRNQVPVE